MAQQKLGTSVPGNPNREFFSRLGLPDPPGRACLGRLERADSPPACTGGYSPPRGALVPFGLLCKYSANPSCRAGAELAFGPPCARCAPGRSLLGHDLRLVQRRNKSLGAALTNHAFLASGARSSARQSLAGVDLIQRRSRPTFSAANLGDRLDPLRKAMLAFFTGGLHPQRRKLFVGRPRECVAVRLLVLEHMQIGIIGVSLFFAQIIGV